ncbi:hypothetical protein YOLOSWAG_196 [Erwinia phage vB_EamM_Yoloswag]|uniref:Uncharacterized protein n=1 Tax=Erwinia phage vB_EamM_Yoloswag TaxID=1958956 RepID=A0A1S6L3B4_9CAUD|nr:hypothetical protein HOR66_gp196 [Erwinia phage vB_EamM_Yoloswag]AQT28675.1 hypothetical protein YOLOSWAG_196 [Erwinia phage vB_EamM_Yoloswag]
MYGLKTHPAFQICRHVVDIDPYTNQPVTELEIIKEVPYNPPAQELNAIKAQYRGSDIFVQPTCSWR